MKLFSKENIQVLIKLSNAHPNNMDLGGVIRNSYRMDNFVKSIPNDTTLGKIVREKIKGFEKEI